MLIEIYQDKSGNEPFSEWLSGISEWLSGIKDRVTAARIRSRLRRIEETGNLGDFRSIGNGVFEFRFQFGSGYWIYFSRIGVNTIWLLRGGDKGSQS